MTISPKPRVARHPKWPALAKRFIKGKVCAVCGGDKGVVPHHKIPVHVDPSKELDESNLMPLCEGRGTVNCHLWCGHLGSWKSHNATASEDAAYFARKVKERP